MTGSPTPLRVAGWTLAALLAGSEATATPPRDPTLPLALHAGPPPGPAPMARLDARRSGVAATPLPLHPAIVWSRRLPGPTVYAPATSRGRILYATETGRLVALDLEGRETWSTALSAAPAVGPAILPGGACVVLTTNGELFSVTSDGRVAWHVAVASRDERVEAPLLVQSDGSLVLAAGRQLIQVESTGRIRARTDTDERTVDLVAIRGAVAAVEESGTVLKWPAIGKPHPAGRFGGRPDGGVTATPNGRLVAVIGGHRLMELDLSTGQQHVRARVTSSELAGPPILLASGTSLTKTTESLLYVHDHAGREIRRVALGGPQRRVLSGGVTQGRGPVLLADRAGAVAYALVGDVAGIVSPDGSLVRLDATCPDPVAITPAGPEGLLLTCRSGRVTLVGADG